MIDVDEIRARNNTKAKANAIQDRHNLLVVIDDLLKTRKQAEMQASIYGYKLAESELVPQIQALSQRVRELSPEATDGTGPQLTAVPEPAESLD